MERFIQKLKSFIHRHENLEKLVLSLWAILWIIRAKFAFRKIKNKGLKRKFKVIILGLRTIPTTNLVYFDAIFGQAFRKLGCQVKMLYCDGALNSCDANTTFRSQRPQCFVCKNLGRFVKNSLNLDCISYRQYISEADIEEIEKKVAELNDKELLDYQYLGVKVGLHARASVIRYFLFGKLDLKEPTQVAALRKKLIYAMIAAKVAERVVAEEKPDVLFSLHGIYSSWGPFADYFRSQSIDTVIYGNMPPRFGHFIFNRNSKANAVASKEVWSNFSHSPLTEKEEAMVDDYFIKRFKGEIGDQEMYEKNFDVEIKKQSLLDSLSKKKYSKRYVIYSNVAWDAAIEGPISKIFDNVFSWIDTTLNFFKQRKDYQLIIKPHPAELVGERCSKGIVDYINEYHSPLPENITLLKPSTPLRASDLVDSNTVSIVFNGTLGLEFAASGIPVLVVADIHYKDAGVVYKVETLEEYLKLLDNPQKIISFAKTNLDLAKKYAYFYYFKAMIRIPFYRDDKWTTINWRAIADIEKLLNDSSNVIKICQKIINKEDIIAPL